MKTKNLVVIGMAALLLMAPGMVNAASGYGTSAALADEDVTMEEALLYAYQDELLAKGTYEKIQEVYGVNNIFSNIEKAEVNHAKAVANVMNRYKIEVPTYDFSELFIAGESMEENYAIGVKAELENIAMYEKFLALDFPADVDRLFENLYRASENHLKAFQNAEENGICGNVGGVRQNQTNNRANNFGNGSGNRVNGSGDQDRTGTLMNQRLQDDSGAQRNPGRRVGR